MPKRRGSSMLNHGVTSMRNGRRSRKFHGENRRPSRSCGGVDDDMDDPPAGVGGADTRDDKTDQDGSLAIDDIPRRSFSASSSSRIDVGSLSPILANHSSMSGISSRHS